jgi:hypothetical protein
VNLAADSLRWPVPLLGIGLLASCGNLLPPSERAELALRGHDLAAADVLMKRAERIATPEIAAVYRLRAAEIAWTELDTNGGSIADVTTLSAEKQHALRIVTAATEGVAINFIGSRHLPERTFQHAGLTYRVRAGLAQKAGIYPLADLESAKAARDIKHTLTQRWHTEPGVGVPVAPKWKRPDDKRMQRFVSSRSYLEPITAVMDFDHPKKVGGVRTISITGYDPTYISRVKLGETEYPLAADYTAPIVSQTVDINEFKVALIGLVHPGVLDSKLILLEPYDKDRIPVLLVHGLNSHPRMWRDVLNDLRADPKLRGKYQFMLFYYPTGWPIPYSALRLREELNALEALVGRPKKMVIIGHSMGGLLAQMQVVSPGRKLWNIAFGKDADRLYRKLPADHLAKRMSLFKADPNIGREVFISTPHRGSGLADLSATGLFIKILSIPKVITGALIDLPANLFQRGQLTSVAGLSPHNKLYSVLDELPIQVPFHSIIGDRGRGDTPNSSDGVVPYWSSHLNGAQSELIVPANHGAYDHPMTIHELRRILLLNAGIKD